MEPQRVNITLVDGKDDGFGVRLRSIVGAYYDVSTWEAQLDVRAAPDVTGTLLLRLTHEDGITLNSDGQILVYLPADVHVVIPVGFAFGGLSVKHPDGDIVIPIVDLVIEKPSGSNIVDWQG